MDDERGSQEPAITPLPPRLSRAVARLPRWPAERVVDRLTRAVLARHPGLIARLGPHADARFLIVPEDLPHAVLLVRRGRWFRARLLPRGQPPVPRADVTISGPLAALLGMVHGVWDGDALFFSRRVTIAGDTAAALALRNAIDDAEIDLGTDLAALAGPLRRLVGPAMDLAGRQLHLPLHRAAEPVR